MITQETIKIDRLLLNAGQIAGVPKNPRFIRDNEFERLKQSIADYPEMLEAREVVAVPYGDKYVVIGGNMRLRVCRELGYKELPVKIYPEDTDPKKLRHFVLIDNKSYGSDDWDCIANEWDEGEVQEWGMETPEEWMNEENNEENSEDENYSRKIEVPNYTPTGKNVKLQDLTEEKKYTELVEEIKGAKLGKDIEDFLMKAATRHIVFNYSDIAEYYANATPGVQGIMEKLALVIIDFDKAIENGFVKMTEELKEEYIKQVKQ